MELRPPLASVGAARCLCCSPSSLEHFIGHDDVVLRVTPMLLLVVVVDTISVHVYVRVHVRCDCVIHRIILMLVSRKRMLRLS